MRAESNAYALDSTFLDCAIVISILHPILVAPISISPRLLLVPLPYFPTTILLLFSYSPLILAVLLYAMPTTRPFSSIY
jgi:hypothetical protein